MKKERGVQMDLKNALKVILEKDNLLRDIQLRIKEKEAEFVEKQLFELKNNISEELYNYIKPEYVDRRLFIILDEEKIEISIANNIEGIVAQYKNAPIEQYSEINAVLKNEMEILDFNFKYKDDYMIFTPLNKVLERIIYLELSEGKGNVVFD